MGFFFFFLHPRSVLIRAASRDCVPRSRRRVRRHHRPASVRYRISIDVFAEDPPLETYVVLFLLAGVPGCAPKTNRESV